MPKLYKKQYRCVLKTFGNSPSVATEWVDEDMFQPVYKRFNAKYNEPNHGMFVLTEQRFVPVESEK